MYRYIYLVPRNEFVAEGKSRHQTTLLQPENGSETTAEKDSLDCSEGNHTLGKRRAIVTDPVQGPVRLLGDTGKSFDGVEQELSEISN